MFNTTQSSPIQKRTKTHSIYKLITTDYSHVQCFLCFTEIFQLYFSPLSFFDLLFSFSIRPLAWAAHFQHTVPPSTINTLKS